MSSTYYQIGLKDGVWTMKDVREGGFKSARECLVHQEQVYKDEIQDAPNKEHIEYMNGWIVAARESLGKL